MSEQISSAVREAAIKAAKEWESEIDVLGVSQRAKVTPSQDEDGTTNGYWVEAAIYVRADELAPEPKPSRKCCPACGGSKFSIQLHAVFRWDGEAYALGPEHLNSDEFPIEDDAMVICDTPVSHALAANCDWEGRVCDMKDMED